mgnify:CR=1 FL=1
MISRNELRILRRNRPRDTQNHVVALYGKVIVPAVPMAAVGADTDGVELHIGDRVRDEMFGLGTVKGNVWVLPGYFLLGTWRTGAQPRCRALLRTLDTFRRRALLV